MSYLEKAKNFAISAHESINQKRKYSNEPYYRHCERVVAILNEITSDQEILAAAWLHDVLEDVAPSNPYYCEQRIRELFGNRVCNLVIELTDSKLEEGNRAMRKAQDRLRLKSASSETKTIKLADLIDNFVDITKNDVGFSMLYTREVELLLPYLSEGNLMLFKQLTELLTDYKRQN